MAGFLVTMRLIDVASRPLNKIATASQNLADKSDRMGSRTKAAMGMMVGGLAALDAALALSAAQAMKLEQAMARLETVTRRQGKNIATAMEDAEEAARQFSSEFTASADEVIRAQFQIATAGIPVSEQIQATQAAFKLAQATMGDFTQSAQMLGSFLNTFGKSIEFNYLTPAKKMEAITDRLSTAVQRFQVTLPVLAESFKFVVGPASQLDLKLSEVTTAIGVLNTAGFRGTLAGTALSNMFNKLDRATDKLDLNPDKFIDLNGNLKSLSAFLDEVHTALEDKTPIEAQNALINTFDIRAGRVAKTLLNNIAAIKRMSVEMDVATGATKKMADIMQETTQSQVKKMGNAIQNLASAIGKSIAPVVKILAASIAGLASVMEGFVGTIGGRFTVILVATAAALGTITVAVAGTVMALVALKAAIAAVNTAGVASLVIMGAIAKWLLIITGAFLALAVVTAIVVGIGALANWIFSPPTAGLLTLDKIREKYKSMADVIGGTASEVDKLSKAIEGQVKAPIARGQEFGSSAWAKKTAELYAKPGVDFDVAAKQAFQSGGGLTGVVKDLGKSSGISASKMLRLARAFITSRNAVDDSFVSLKQWQKAALFTKEMVNAQQVAFQGLGKGSEDAAIAINQLARNTEIYFGALKQGNAEAKEKSTLALFESFSAELQNLRSVSSLLSPEIAGVVNEFEKLVRAGVDLSATQEAMDKFRETTGKDWDVVARKLISLNPTLGKLVAQTAEFTNEWGAVKTSMTQANRSIESAANSMKLADVGLANYHDQWVKSNEQIDKSKQKLQDLIAGLPALQQELEDAKARGMDFGPAFEEAKKTLKKKQAVIIGIQSKINEQYEINQGKKIMALLSKGMGVLSAQTKSHWEKLGGEFGGVLTKAISGEFRKSGTSLTEALRGVIHGFAMGAIEKEIGMTFQQQFVGLIEPAIQAQRNMLIRRGLTATDLLAGIQSGELQAELEEIWGAIPGMKDLLGPMGLFGDPTSDLMKDMQKVMNDASIAMITASSRAATTIRSAQDVVRFGNVDDPQSRKHMIGRLSELLRTAHIQGTKEAESTIKSMLSTLMDADSDMAANMKAFAGSAATMHTHLVKGSTALKTGAVSAATSITTASATMVAAATKTAATMRRMGHTFTPASGIDPSGSPSSRIATYAARSPSAPSSVTVHVSPTVTVNSSGGGSESPASTALAPWGMDNDTGEEFMELIKNEVQKGIEEAARQTTR
ncbi:MAG: phage tail tape measure protein [Flammeovirgaceae bacterium]|nr:phage tail tape measure protein [Flammeovirgaceae bacterium]